MFRVTLINNKIFESEKEIPKPVETLTSFLPGRPPFSMKTKRSLKGISTKTLTSYVERHVNVFGEVGKRKSEKFDGSWEVCTQCVSSPGIPTPRKTSRVWERLSGEKGETSTRSKRRPALSQNDV